MAISFVGATHSSSLTGSQPAGAQEGDVFLAIIQGSGTITGPSGWTKIGADRTVSGFTASVWRITRGSSAPALTWAGGSSPALDIVCYRGADGTPHATGQSAAGSAVAPSLTVGVSDAVLICLNADASQEANAAPSGMTMRSVGGSSYYNKIADLALGAPGSTGTKTFTNTGSINPIGTWSVALAPATTSRAPMQHYYRQRRGVK